ncbi:MAG: hypothetical protein F4W91_11405 [Gemmatimonadetes bacterium]|nr:hypothetical protein [Gemmatimonadota bacterium]
MSNQVENTEDKVETSTETTSESGGCWNAFKAIFALFFIAGLIGMCFFDDEDEQVDESAVEEESQYGKEFSFTVNEFVRRYNRSAEEIEVNQIAIQGRREVITGIEYRLTKEKRGDHHNPYRLSLLTNMNSNKVKSIFYMIFVVADENKTELERGLEIILRFTATFMAVENPDMKSADRGRRLQEIGVMQSIKDKEEITTVKNNIVYKVDVVEVLGAVTFSIKPVQ